MSVHRKAAFGVVVVSQCFWIVSRHLHKFASDPLLGQATLSRMLT